MEGYNNGFKDLMERGRLQKKMYKYKKGVEIVRAIYCFEKAVKLCPDDVTARYELADCWLEFGGPDSVKKAIEYFEPTFNISRETATEYADMLAQRRMNVEDPVGARKLWRLIMEYNPEDSFERKNAKKNVEELTELINQGRFRTPTMMR
ncbi:MAG: tetratricopeptide repeat protein [Candidatus Aenigmatarchaeota archaeon]